MDDGTLQAAGRQMFPRNRRYKISSSSLHARSCPSDVLSPHHLLYCLLKRPTALNVYIICTLLLPFSPRKRTPLYSTYPHVLGSCTNASMMGCTQALYLLFCFLTFIVVLSVLVQTQVFSFPLVVRFRGCFVPCSYIWPVQTHLFPLPHPQYLRRGQGRLWRRGRRRER